MRAYLKLLLLFAFTAGAALAGKSGPSCLTPSRLRENRATGMVPPARSSC